MLKVILFDFDGVILNSLPVRDYGFRKIFEDYSSSAVEMLINYHTLNGGLSRFNKIEYFYTEILKQKISEDKIQMYAHKFSKIMKSELINSKYLIKETIEFIKKNYKNYIFHIVSGSEQKELQFLCKELNINNYFKTIEGSPTYKNDLVKNILYQEKYKLNETILIGDSINDYNAAAINGLKFYGYNNETLKNKDGYINTFKEFEF